MRIIMTQRAFKYRFYPTDSQAAVLSRQFGAARFVWNLGLSVRGDTYHETGLRVTTNDLMKMLPLWKEEFAWLRTVSDVVLQQVLRDQDRAFKNFFDGLKGKRPRMGCPRFKSRATARKSVRYTRNGFRYRNGHIFLAKMSKPLPIEWSRPLPEGADPSSVTVSCDPQGRWFISIVVETDIAPLPVTGRAVGVDLGLKTFAVLSDETVIDHPGLLRKKEARLARYQRQMARRRRPKGHAPSANYLKAKKKVAKQHAKVADARRDFLHKASTDIVRTYDVIVIEDLAVKNMVKNRHLAKSVSDSGWASFRSMLDYKAQWYGKRLVVIDRFAPTSKTCSDCGEKNNKLALSDREWACTDCGTLHDRDLNAAKNILAAGLAVTACGEDVRRAEDVSFGATSVKQEPIESVAA